MSISADYLRLQATADALQPQPSSPAARISRIANKAIDQPFKLGAKRFAYASADCVTYVETALAAGLTSESDTYYRLSQRLRHKDGVTQFLERNFVTPDWVKNNRSLLED